MDLQVDLTLALQSTPLTEPLRPRKIMATKAPLGSLYAEGPEEQGLVDEIKGSYAKLREALDSRQNQLFDPVLLAMSQGFLAPTKTGSFGEVLSNVAGQVGPAQQAEQKRAQEIASMKMELAQRELGQRQSARGEAMFREMLPRAGGQAGAPGAAPAAAPGTPATPGAPAAPQGRQITSEDIARLASMPGMEGKAKILQDMIRSDRDRFTISMNGIVFDKDTQQYLNLEIPGQKQEPFTTRFGRFEMTPFEYSQYKRAEEAGEGQQWLDKFRGTTTTGAPSRPAVRPTVAEAAAEAKGAETRATETTKAEVGRTQEMIDAGKDATGRLASYSALRSIAARPDAKEIFGIFNRPDFGSALLNLVQEGVKTPGQTSIQAGALEDSLRNIGLKQDQIDRYRFGLSVMANIQLQQAKLAAGQGAISNFERDLFANATLSPKDNPGTILAKLNMLEARANFDRQRAAALRKTKMDADEFLDTPEGQRMAQDYLNKISSLATNMGGKAPARSGVRPAPGSYGPAASKLREELGVR
jgi:hypothetical protein